MATLTIVVSKIDMIVPSTTTMDSPAQLGVDDPLAIGHASRRVLSCLTPWCQSPETLEKCQGFS